MKRDLIYLILIVAAIAAVKVTARTTPETPAEIRPLRIEAGFTKTVHILFPSPVTYIDIGSMDIIAGKADGAENVVRVKAAVRNFAAETNLTVITEDGGFFTFDVHYAENPVVSTLNLTVQEPQPESMKKPAAVGYPQPTAPASESRVLLREVGREKPGDHKTHVERHIPPKPYGREGHSHKEVRHRGRGAGNLRLQRWSFTYILVCITTRISPSRWIHGGSS